jgi:hypothetical protein
MKLPLTGGCLCGDVRYEITREPTFVYACHCPDCQGSTSSAFSIGVVVPADRFQVVTGDENTRMIFGGIAASNGRVKQRRVCANCGTWLYGDARNHARYGQVRFVRGGTFDDQTWIVPAAHYWIKRAHSWIVFPEDVRTYDTQPG